VQYGISLRDVVVDLAPTPDRIIERDTHEWCFLGQHLRRPRRHQIPNAGEEVAVAQRSNIEHASVT